MRTIHAALSTFLSLTLFACASTAANTTLERQPDEHGLPTTTVLHCGTLLAIPGQPPQREMSIIIQNDTIVDVVDGYINPRLPHTTIDLTDKFVLPGLIDCHTHVTFQLQPMEVRLKRTLTEQPTHSAIDGTVYARKTLAAGFTTVRNVGSFGDDIYALRDRIADGMIPGPRILAAGRTISVTGGHADRTNGISPILRPEMTPMEGIADGPYEMRKATRERIKQGSDVIKITATGGVLSNTAAGIDQQMFEDEIRAVVETAHSMGRKVAAHAHGTNGIKAAVRGGVDSIEHGTYLDAEAISLFTSTGCYLVPTIHAGKYVEQQAAVPGYFNPAIKAKAEAVGPQMQSNFGRAYRAGVNIAFGTDVGVGAHGTNALEFIYMNQAGMTPMDCIKTATVNAADLCGISDQVGTIEQGKSADIIAVAGDPLADVAVLGEVDFVMTRRQVVRAIADPKIASRQRQPSPHPDGQRLRAIGAGKAQVPDSFQPRPATPNATRRYTGVRRLTCKREPRSPLSVPARPYSCHPTPLRSTRPRPYWGLHPRHRATPASPTSSSASSTQRRNTPTPSAAASSSHRTARSSSPRGSGSPMPITQSRSIATRSGIPRRSPSSSPPRLC